MSRRQNNPEKMMWTKEKYDEALELIITGYKGKKCGGQGPGPFKKIVDNLLMLNILEFLSNVDLGRFACTASGHRNLVSVMRTIDLQRAIKQVGLCISQVAKHNRVPITIAMTDKVDPEMLEAQIHRIGNELEQKQAEQHTQHIGNTKSVYESGLAFFCFCFAIIFCPSNPAGASFDGRSGGWSATSVNIARAVTIIIGGLSVWGFWEALDSGPSGNFETDAIRFGSTGLGMFLSGACLLADGVQSAYHCIRDRRYQQTTSVVSEGGRAVRAIGQHTLAREARRPLLEGSGGAAGPGVSGLPHGEHNYRSLN